MLTLSPEELARLEAGAVGCVWLVELEFTSQTYRFTSFNVPLTIGGHEYQALGVLAGVSDITESQDTDTQTLTLTLSVPDQAVLSLVLGNVEGYRGRTARVSLLLLDEAFRPVGQPRERFRGEMEPVRVQRDQPTAQSTSVGGRIELPVSRVGLSRARNADGLRLTDEQQRLLYPGDRGLEYVRSLIERPALWLSKRFQEQ